MIVFAITVLAALLCAPLASRAGKWAADQCTKEN